MSRRAFDFYPTPAWATRELLAHVPIKGAVLECCSGALDIANVLAESCLVFTNDIDADRKATWHSDARSQELWERIGAVEWVVSNPPFSQAFEIVQRACATVPHVAMLLRLSFLEPTYDRGPWLAEHPPDQIVVLPRISFTGDGKTDSVTCAWMVWSAVASTRGIVVIPKSERGALLDGDAA